MHLWPLEGDWFWGNRALGGLIEARWNFLVVALQDGRWSTSMSVLHMEADRDNDGRIGR